jgi:hypothetical protein
MSSQLVTERQPVVVQQRKSPVGRALIGGIALGPIGAIAGAASGLNGKSTIKYVEKTVRKEVETEGPKLLVVGTSDPAQPMLKIMAPRDDVTEEWLHRLRAAIYASQPMTAQRSAT